MGQTKDNTIVICGFSIKHAAIWNKSKDSLDRNRGIMVVLYFGFELFCRPSSALGLNRIVDLAVLWVLTVLYVEQFVGLEKYLRPCNAFG